LWGSREPAIRSQFLTEIPEELLTSKKLTDRVSAISHKKRSRGSQDATDRVLTSQSQNWAVGDRILHKPLVSVKSPTFGSGTKSQRLSFPVQKSLTPKLPPCNAWNKTLSTQAPTLSVQGFLNLNKTNY